MQQSFDCGITSAELTQSQEPRPPGIERCCDLPKSATAPLALVKRCKLEQHSSPAEAEFDRPEVLQSARVTSGIRESAGPSIRPHAPPTFQRDQSQSLVP